MSKIVCPDCGSNNVMTERRPDGYLETLWKSNFRELSGMLFDTKEEALAATVARFKEMAE